MKRVAAAVGWLTVAGASAWLMLIWVLVWFHGVGERSGYYEFECGARIGEPIGAPDSVVTHFWFWDCFGPSGELVHRSWLPLLGRALALVPPGLLVGVILYAGRFRRTSPARWRLIREMLRLAGWMVAGMLAAGLVLGGFLAAGFHRIVWVEALSLIVAVAGWIAWAWALRRALGLRPAASS